MFDEDKDGCISFKEFIFGLSITSRGNVDEKLECMSLWLCIPLALPSTHKDDPRLLMCRGVQAL